MPAAPAPQPAPTWLEALTGDAQTRALFADTALLAHMRAFEAALAKACAAEGVIEPASAEKIATHALAAPLDPAALAQGMARDGMAGPEFVRQMRAGLPPDLAPLLHLGATSQDLHDTAIALAARAFFSLLAGRLTALLARLETLEQRDGARPLMAITRMQDALPFQVRDKLATWRSPLAGASAALAAHPIGPLPLQLGGPIGTRRPWPGAAIAAHMAQSLRLAAAPCWHTDRTPITQMTQPLIALAATLGKIGADITLLTQTRLADAVLAGAGRSSAMAHKQNPVGAEVLVALARHSAGLGGLLNHALLHENERSGISLTLEMLTLPALCESVGAATRIADFVLGALHFVPETA